MASLIPGFEYDIFISYRQKDNKYDGWVTHFVDHLKAELESTFKEEISVYFDINPHDGLLETHDVDASLKDKLKCLIFIPILSRTYCDPKAFAWEHEFKAFVGQASHDQFGLKIRLPNGNVASRVLPIRIHDLDIADITLCEEILDGVLRGVEFVYKEPGVNRSLTPDDDEKANLNKTKYRNQINKVALAINDIIQGLKTEPEWVYLKGRIEKEAYNQSGEKKEQAERIRSEKSSRSKLIAIVVIIAALAFAAIFVYLKVFKRDRLDYLRSKGKISVAVMPFRNMTNVPDYEHLGDWIQENLINYLSVFSDELKVKQFESTNSLIQSNGIANYSSLSTSVASNLSKKLDADIFIIGSFRISGPDVQLSAQLTDTRTKEVIRAFEEGPATENQIDSLINSLRTGITDFLILTIKQKELPDVQQGLLSTSSPEAYGLYMDGKKAFFRNDWGNAEEKLREALKSDPNFVFAAMLLSWAYINNGEYDKGKEIHLRFYAKKDSLPTIIKTKLLFQHALDNEGPSACIKYLKQLQDYDDQDPFNYSDLADIYIILNQYDNAFSEYKKAFEIYKNWGSGPSWINQYLNYGSVLHEKGKLSKEKRLYRNAELNFPNHPALIRRLAVRALSEGKTKSANEYLENYRSLSKENSIPETEITTNLANIYWEAGLPDQAEEYFSDALSSSPGTPERMYALAWFLIDTDRNIIEGIGLVNKALESDPDNYNYLDCKGWGLYKKGKYKEALEILQKSWDLRMQNAIYDHPAYLHLDAARKAVAGQR
jgi:tetratricopeptide (TPR) repeat protein